VGELRLYQQYTKLCGSFRGSPTLYTDEFGGDLNVVCEAVDQLVIISPDIFFGKYYRNWEYRHSIHIYLETFVITNYLLQNYESSIVQDRLCGLVVRVLGYRSGGPGSIRGITRKTK
jgi:hypothetical protein